MYLAAKYAGRRLHAGKFWIGFPSRTNCLLRLGLFGELGETDRVFMWGFSLLIIGVSGRKFEMAFIHYLVPSASDSDPDLPVNGVRLELLEDRADRADNGVRLERLEDGEDNPRRDAWRLLMSVIHFIFTADSHLPLHLCTVHQISYQ